MTHDPTTSPSSTWTAFAGSRRIASGDVGAMAGAVLAFLDDRRNTQHDGRPVLVFNDDTGVQVTFNFEGDVVDVAARLLSAVPAPPLLDDDDATTATTGKKGPGRPKLGVVAREVTLLPRHWAWLETQSGGASAALRRLVEAAKKADPEGERRRRRQAAAGTFMWAIAGDLENFEEASRALYANDRDKLTTLIAAWPTDIAAHVEHLLDR